MTVLPMLAVGIFMNFVAVLFVLVAIVLVLVILIQKGRGGGLSAAFGGGMAGSLLGSKTGDFLTWVTIVLVGVFLLLAVVLAKFYRPPAGGQFGAQSTASSQTAGATSVPAEETGTAAPGSVGGEAGPVESAPTPAPEAPGSVPAMPADTNAAGG